MLADLGHFVGESLGHRGTIVAALRPVYSRYLRAAYGRRGLPWTVNGEALRIDPSTRRMLPHENEPELFSFLRDCIQPGSVVLDIGAFLGTYAILEARRVGPAGRVVAFEPSPETFVLLERHLMMNGLTAPQAEARCAAVGARSETRRLVTWDDEPYRNMIANSGAPGVAVDTVTLDEVCGSWPRLPDWIRMDVQGLEFDVLEGARALLRATRGRIQIVAEMHPDQWPDYGIAPADAADRLADLGLRARPLKPGASPFAQGEHAVLEFI